MRDPRDDDIPLEEVARKYWNHDERTMKRWAGNRHKKDTPDRYPFPIYRLGGQKSPWMVKASDLKRYRDQVYKDYKNCQEVA